MYCRTLNGFPPSLGFPQIHHSLLAWIPLTARFSPGLDSHMMCVQPRSDLHLVWIPTSYGFPFGVDSHLMRISIWFRFPCGVDFYLAWIFVKWGFPPGLHFHLVLMIAFSEFQNLTNIPTSTILQPRMDSPPVLKSLLLWIPYLVWILTWFVFPCRLDSHPPAKRSHLVVWILAFSGFTEHTWIPTWPEYPLERGFPPCPDPFLVLNPTGFRFSSGWSWFPLWLYSDYYAPPAEDEEFVCMYTVRNT